MLPEIPVWLIGIAVFASMMAAAFVGERFHAARRRGDGGDDSAAYESYVVSGVVGLLALLLGFTFALAVDRFEARRLLVLDEANAIRTAYVQAQTFPAPHRERLRVLLARYADNRLALAASAERDDVPQLVGASRGLQQALWAETLAAVAPQRDDVSSTFMQSMSELLTVGAARRAQREARVPFRVFVVLFIYMIMTAAVMGFVMGPRHRVVVAVLLALTTMSLTLIVDIDGASLGGVRESQQPMEDLGELVRRQPPLATGNPGH